MVADRDNKEPPSSDAETDRMEGLDERESQLEQMTKDDQTGATSSDAKDVAADAGDNAKRPPTTDSTYNFTDAGRSHSGTEPSSASALESEGAKNNGTVNDKKRKLDDEEEDEDEGDDEEGEGDDEEGDEDDEEEEDDDEKGNTTKRIKLDDKTTNAQKRSLSINNIHANHDEEDEDEDEDEDDDDDEPQVKNLSNVKTKKLSDQEDNIKDTESGIEGKETEDQGDEDEEEEEEDVVENDEEHEKEEQQRESNRVSAMNQLKDIEIMFAQLKDKLYETQLNKLEFELKLCQTNKHPELLEYMKMVDDDFQKKAERLMNLQKYKLKCLDNQTRAYRVALHQQFMKCRQDLKSKEVVKITTDWYDINKERRTMDMQTLKLPNYYQYNETINSVNIDDYLPSLVHQRNSVYKELSVLQGLVDYKQMIPSALNNLKGCSEDEINTDLKDMGLIQ